MIRVCSVCGKDFMRRKLLQHISADEARAALIAAWESIKPDTGYLDDLDNR